MRIENKEFLKKLLEKFPDNFKEPILEIGSYRIPEQEDLANIRELFPSKKFIGVDMRQGSGVDRIENIHALKIPSNSVGAVICIDTLEHVEDVTQAMREIYRVLKPGGIVVLVSVFHFYIHDYPSDYWRFTPECFRKLLQRFSQVVVESDGEKDYPVGIYGAGIKRKKYSASLELFQKIFQATQHYFARRKL